MRALRSALDSARRLVVTLRRNPRRIPRHCCTQANRGNCASIRSADGAPLPAYAPAARPRSTARGRPARAPRSDADLAAYTERYPRYEFDATTGVVRLIDEA